MSPLSPSAAVAPTRDAAVRGLPLRVVATDGSLRARWLAIAAEHDTPLAVFVATETDAWRLAADAAFFMGLRAPSPDDASSSIALLPELDT